MSDPRIIVEPGAEQIIVGVENDGNALLAALDDRVDERTVDELLETLEIELRHTARINGGRFR